MLGFPLVKRYIGSYAYTDWSLGTATGRAPDTKVNEVVALATRESTARLLVERFGDRAVDIVLSVNCL